MSAGGGLRPPRAAPGSLNQRTGPHRQIAAVRVDLATLRAAAHRHGGTTNDAILVAVAGALRQVLKARGEHISTLVVTVPVSGRRFGPTAAGGEVARVVLDCVVQQCGAHYIGIANAVVTDDPDGDSQQVVDVGLVLPPVAGMYSRR
jgi:hypothetical protein